MANRMTVKTYHTPKNIYASHHKIELPVQINSTEAIASGLAVLLNGRYVVLAGTVYPTNDSSAEGLIVQDYDVTDGDVAGAICVHGAVKVSALPVTVTTAAKTALKQIIFRSPVIKGTPSLSCTTPISLASGALVNDNIVVQLDGAEFRRLAGVDDFTISSSPTQKATLTIMAVEVLDDNHLVRLHIYSSEALTAGKILLAAKASAVDIGKAPSATVEIIEVA